MNIYLLNAREHASWDESEAWIVVAESPEQAWSVVLEDENPDTLPSVRRYDEKGYHVEVQPVSKITLSDVQVEMLGTSPEAMPRVAFAAFLRG